MSFLPKGAAVTINSVYSKSITYFFIDLTKQITRAYSIDSIGFQPLPSFFFLVEFVSLALVGVPVKMKLFQFQIFVKVFKIMETDTL